MRLGVADISVASVVLAVANSLKACYWVKGHSENNICKYLFERKLISFSVKGSNHGAKKQTRETRANGVD